ncbi:hypothetical protein EDEG_02497 [Edhazardia aedis USNM 41457]|uniref:Uncharacterized protein n=1 Tax=Edhazardia aedis (strain USNM 41457) TaxID=1003232 RepID=J9D5S5_EDHAE|nr:hypothetical protein EDEG_02497 [Edhazardia aedis USNM 41457]|eukprot:EJW03126.1 hypothetical protein EDEG_02497 [Edhazardia aedis USNM 41457]
MGNNILKKLQQKIKQQNSKLTTTLNNEVMQTFNTKKEEINFLFSEKETQMQELYKDVHKKMLKLRTQQVGEMENLKKIVKQVNCEFDKLRDVFECSLRKVDCAVKQFEEMYKSRNDDFVSVKNQIDNSLENYKETIGKKISSKESDNAKVYLNDILGALL